MKRKFWGRDHFMKKGAALATSVLMVFSLYACGKEMKEAEEKSLYDQGLDVIGIMGEMTQSDEYVSIVTGNGELQAMIRDIGAGNHDTPQKVYSISVSKDSLSALIGLGSLDEISQEFRGFLDQRMVGSLMSIINARGGAEVLAAVNACAVQKTFVNTDAEEPVIYLYTFADAVPAAVTFTVGEDHSVAANGIFIAYEGFSCDSAEDIKDFFEEMGIEAEVDPI